MNCPICEIELTRTRGRTMAVRDHCHVTGKKRATICQRCNLGLGMFNDNVDILINAVVYLQTLGSFGAEETPKYVRDAAKRLDVDEYDMSKVIMLLKGKFMADIRRNKSKRKIRVNPLILKRLHAHQT